MFDKIKRFFKKNNDVEQEGKDASSKDAAKERLHLVLMQDRANVSADFLELMKQEIIDVIKKYIEIDETSIDVRLTNKENEDGTNGAPALYANIPIVNIKNEVINNVKTQDVDIKEVNNKEKEDKENKEVKEEKEKISIEEEKNLKEIKEVQEKVTEIILDVKEQEKEKKEEKNKEDSNNEKEKKDNNEVKEEKEKKDNNEKEEKTEQDKTKENKKS